MGDGRDQPVIIPYRPRPLQLAIHSALDAHRFAVLVCHRRFGKTVLAVNHLIKGALTCRLLRPRFAYIAPTFRQGKAVAWDYVKHYALAVPGCVVNESELRVDFPNGGQVRVYGADSPDSLRGIYIDGVVPDEFGMMQGRVWTEVIRPALSDRLGWAAFIGTPNGKNAFYDLVQHARTTEGWYLAIHKASETGIIPDSELALARQSMSEDEYAQEYECSFEASVRGAIYAKEMSRARADGRVGKVPWDPAIPVHTAWDLGRNDSTAVWFLQQVHGETRAIDYYEASGEALGHYVNVLRSKPYTYGEHMLPHDVEVVDLSEPTGRSRKEILESLGLNVRVCPRLSLEDGIEATRLLLARAWFDETKTAQGIECLQNYRREENLRTGELKTLPVHDWASHGADAYRTAAVLLRDEQKAREITMDYRWIV